MVDSGAVMMRRAWAAWFTLGVGGFAALEYLAVKRYPQDTLSKITRETLGLAEPRGRVTRPLFTVSVLTFTSWFLPHILRQPGGVELLYQLDGCPDVEDVIDTLVRDSF